MRIRIAITVAASLLVFVAIFVVFILKRADAAMLAALEAAGAVVAGLCAAAAAVGAAIAALESRAAAQQARLAARRAVQPRLLPSRDGSAGTIRVTGAAATEVMTVWQIDGEPTVVASEPRVDPGGEFAVALPDGRFASLWVSYRDASGAFEWQDTWDEHLRRLESRAVD
ncbi:MULTISPECIES: hypothetical protein [unclassified Microbacterium]|uniref:hypothetical protein n=1 Tax=unclassified Microbacterium TaxID=2609290 RepID=UPI0012F76C2B|nr:hypothetical protein [Microbacterium sp. MAH-37]MVQ42436.1 hypothetical protein [Microbacterium sp. MAH-37]